MKSYLCPGSDRVDPISLFFSTNSRSHQPFSPSRTFDMRSVCVLGFSYRSLSFSPPSVSWPGLVLPASILTRSPVRPASSCWTPKRHRHHLHDEAKSGAFPTSRGTYVKCVSHTLLLKGVPLSRNADRRPARYDAICGFAASLGRPFWMP